MLFLLEYSDSLEVESNVENMLYTNYQSALDTLEQDYGIKYQLDGLDPELDRILIWRLDADKPMVIWHYSGTEFEQDASDERPGGMPQGVLPGHTKSLWEEVVDYTNNGDSMGKD